MRPLKITIPGSYWDSYIYKGRLYLFGVDGSIKSVDWGGLVRDFRVSEDLAVAFICAFLRSDYLYSNEVRDLLHDRDIKNLMSLKFDRLSRQDMCVDDGMLYEYVKGVQDTPFPFPHADIEVYKDQIYFGSVEGLYSGACNKRTKYPISTKINKMWDGPTLSLSASYGSIAIAGGSEGLFEKELEPSYGFRRSDDPRQLSNKSCRDCGWTYYSVFASSDKSGFLAEFTKNKNGEYDKSAHREFFGVEEALDIFGSDGYSWGMQDKLCQAVPNGIKVARYQPWSHYEDQRTSVLGVVEFEPWKGEVISAATASFGVIVELENAIVVFPSDGDPITISGEPVNWRVFPRSRNYENQMHVIYDECLEIYSFNHDYLVDQEDKMLGSKVFSGRAQRAGGGGLFYI